MLTALPVLTFNERGDALVRLERIGPDVGPDVGPEAGAEAGPDVETEAERFGPVTLAVVLPRVPGGVLLVFNRQRDYWELPGGMREGDETPRGCAERELREETGIVTAGLRLRLCAVMVLDLRPSRWNPTRREECGAVFRTDYPQVPAPFESDETGGLAVWPVDRLPTRTGVLDAHLVRALWPGARSGRGD